MRIFHIAGEASWNAGSGEYCGDSLSSEGFIHCSDAHQLMAVAKANFHGASDLLVLEIDPSRVLAEIRYENLEGGADLFPHIYGPLNREAVVSVHPLLPGASGDFTEPAVISQWSKSPSDAAL